MTTENKTEAEEEARKAAELATSSIRRFLDAHSKSQTQPTKAQVSETNLAGEAVGSAAELAAINIRRFIEMQSIHSRSLIMRAHQATDVKEE